jgi:hypothetical protein
MYKKKQVARTGSDEGWVHCIKINPAEGMWSSGFLCILQY